MEKYNTLMAKLGKLNPLTSLLVLSLIMVSFLSGVLWQRLDALEKGNKNVPVTKVANTAIAQGSTAAEPNNPTSPLSVDNLKKYAKEMGLDTAKLNECLDNGKMAPKIEADRAEAKKLAESLWDMQVLEKETFPTKESANFGTPTFFINGRYLPGAQRLSAFQQIIEEELNRRPKAADIKRVDIPAGGQIKGSGNAPVTIVEFSDFECPFCAEFVGVDRVKQLATSEDGIYTKYLKELIDNGTVKFIFKQLPLPELGHKNTQKASEASLCAAEQGKFWEYHDKLFESQK